MPCVPDFGIVFKGIKAIETRYPVYIDASTMQFDPDGYELKNGWKPIPHHWIDEIK